MFNIIPALRAGVPLLVVETSDPAQTINTVVAQTKDLAILTWDCCNGLRAINDLGIKALEILFPPTEDMDIKSITTRLDECLVFLTKCPKNTLVFLANPHRLWDDRVTGAVPITQAIWNLRDLFAQNACVLVMNVPIGTTVPTELKNDVITLTDTLPTKEEMDTVMDTILTAAKLKLSTTEKVKVRDTLLGLSSFGADQVLAMSITKDGVDHEVLREKKRRMIEQTPGLSVWRGSNRFADIGGYDNIKSFSLDICKGNDAPKAVLFIDEIEKAMQGAAAGANDGGTSSDQHQVLLTWMENHKTTGIILIGPPGSGKSELAKALGNEAGIPTIAFDLGAMKDRLVGSSEQRIRTALQVVDAVSQGSVLVIATCNSIGNLSPELRRRFCFGTFFFPLPSKTDRQKIWKIWLTQFKLDGTLPDDTGWTGAEIRNCCVIACRLKRSLVEAAKFIVPVSVSAAEDIDRLCKQSHKKYINACAPGLYVYERMEQQPAPMTQIGVKRAIARN